MASHGGGQCPLTLGFLLQMRSPGVYVTALSGSKYLHTSVRLSAPFNTELYRPHARRGGHGPHGGSVESTAEAPINDKIRSQHSLQPNPLALLLFHDHTSMAMCHCGHVVAHSPR